MAADRAHLRKSSITSGFTSSLANSDLGHDIVVEEEQHESRSRSRSWSRSMRMPLRCNGELIQEIQLLEGDPYRWNILPQLTYPQRLADYYRFLVTGWNYRSEAPSRADTGLAG
jgi:hypothetical protein